MRAPIVDTRGILKHSCCSSCARGGPCSGSAPAAGHDDHAHAHAAPSGACCGSCASGGTCESAMVPAMPSGDFGMAPAAPTPRRRVTRDARGALRRTKLRDLGAGRMALFWGPSDAEEAAFQALYKRFNAILEHKDPGTGQFAAALMKVRQPTIGAMIDEWLSFATLWVKGDEDPDQLSTHSKNLAIIENTARDLYGFQKPKSDVVVPLPQDSPILGGIAEAGEVLDKAGVPMPDPHSQKGLDFEAMLRVLQSAAYLAAIAGGLYVAAPVVRRLAMRRAA